MTPAGVIGAPHNADIEVFTPSPDLDGVGTVRVVAGPDRQRTLTWSNIADPANHAFGTGVILPAASAESATKVALIAARPRGGHARAGLRRGAAGGGWTTAPALNVPRSHHNTVLLPDGSMVTVGGGLGNVDNDKSLFRSDSLSVELYDPATGAWRQGPAQQEGRAYHSTALLLPDGRVVSAGDDTNGGNSTDTGEIYSPPYLFKGATAADHRRTGRRGLRGAAHCHVHRKRRGDRGPRDPRRHDPCRRHEPALRAADHHRAGRRPPSR
jgi:hypothetical protein